MLQVQPVPLMAVIVMPAGALSVTVTRLGLALGAAPILLTVKVNCTPAWPRLTGFAVTWVLVMVKSARRRTTTSSAVLPARVPS